MDKLNYINGQWTGNELNRMDVVNPANNQVVGTVPVAGVNETRQAIEAAHSAFKPWSALTVYERADYLEQFYQLMQEQKEEIGLILTKEMGKPLAEAIGEVDYAASFIKWFLEEGKREYGRTIPSHQAHKRMLVTKQPVGVVGAITPWNFPAAMITRKIGPALISGCTVIVKPSKQTPLTAIKLIELLEQTGIPAGVVNLLTGGSREIAGELLSNAKVKKITFTGSTEVGKVLIRQSAENVKKLSLELGGHAPIIVFDDADIDRAVKETLASKFRNGGQTCICGNRIYVQDGIYETFVTKFAEAVKQLQVGDGLAKGTNIGPIIDEAGFKKVDSHVKNAIELGAECVIGGKGEIRDGGHFYYPTVLSNVSSDMLIMNEETFGPVAPVQKFSTDEEVIELANETTPYGLAAYVFTENYKRGLKTVEALDYGIVGWNDGTPSAAQAPFGGMKESGLGREGGIEGLEEFLETKYVSIGL